MPHHMETDLRVIYVQYRSRLASESIQSDRGLGVHRYILQYIITLLQNRDAANTQRPNNVVTTSLQRRDVAATS